MSDNLYGVLGVLLIAAILLPSLGRASRRGQRRKSQASLQDAFESVAMDIGALRQEVGQLRAENEVLRRMAEGMGPPPSHSFDQEMAEEMAARFRQRSADAAAGQRRRDAMRILDIQEPWTEPELRRAYTARMKIFHPDHGGSDEEFIALQAAYEILKKDARRSSAAH